MIRAVETHVKKGLLKPEADELSDQDISKSYSRRGSRAGSKFKPDNVMVSSPRNNLKNYLYSFFSSKFISLRVNPKIMKVQIKIKNFNSLT